MWNYNYSNELYHYGIQGMRWGKRKAKTNSSNSKNTKKSKNQNGNKNENEKNNNFRKKLKRGLDIGLIAASGIMATHSAIKLNFLVKDMNYNIRMEQGIKYANKCFSPNGIFKGAKIKDIMAARKKNGTFLSDTLEKAKSVADGESFGKALKNIINYEHNEKKYRQNILNKRYEQIRKVENKVKKRINKNLNQGLYKELKNFNLHK